MSVEAITWAFQQPIPHASAKFVLVAMANHADVEMRCWPSSAHLCSQTAQDRKTVQANIARLREWGFIADTGERRGATKQVIVYQLKTPKTGPVMESGNDLESSPKTDEKTPEIGAIKEAQNRTTSSDETGPNFPTKRPVFPHKQAQISPETGPKTGHGTIRNHQEPSGNPVEPRGPKATRLSKDWKPSPDEIEFCQTNRPDLDPHRTAERFRDYWIAAPGAKGRKLDWPATWRNWVRNERAVPRASPQQSRNTNMQRLNDRINGRTSHESDDRIIDINEPPPGKVG